MDLSSPPVIAEDLTSDIRALARGLKNDPTRIFNYVHDNIRQVFYFGSKKGAELTLLERSGNDFDQCALLSALLTAAGYSPTYQFGLMQIPYDSSNHQDIHHWLALTMTNSVWANTITYFTYFLGQRGYRVWFDMGDANTLAIQRVWVKVTIADTNYVLDPAFKVSEPISGVNLSTAMGLSTNYFMTNAGGTNTANYVQNLNEANIRANLTLYTTNLLNYIQTNSPNADVQQILGGQRIVSSVGTPLQQSTLFPTYTDGNLYPILNWNNQPTNFMSTLSIVIANRTQFFYTPQLEGQRLSLIFTNNGVAQIWLEESLLLTATNEGSGHATNVILRATHPYGGWDTTNNIPIDGGLFDTSTTNSYQRTNSSYAIAYAYDANQAWLQEREQKLAAYLQEGYPTDSRQVVSETLNVMGLSWMVQTELNEEIMAQEWGLLPQNHHRFGRMAQEIGSGYYIDVYMQMDGTFPGSGYATADILRMNQGIQVSSYFSSAMEHGIIEQLQSSNLLAASTMKMLEIANTNSQKIYLATSTNWSSIRGQLTGYDTSTLYTDYIAKNYFLLLPQDGTNALGQWKGYGGVALQNSASYIMLMLIQGGFSGGYVDNPNATVNPSFISESSTAQQQSIVPNSPLVTGSTAGDPVTMPDARFQIDAEDLSLGQMEPRGINFERIYSSARANYNPAGMADGWLHNYYFSLLPVSAPNAGLGLTTPQQMVSMIAASWTALNIYNPAPNPRNWTVTALIAKWSLDQLINNSISVTLGKDTIQFIKQPDGSFTPPANCTMSMTTSSTGYTLQERRGRAFNFNTNGQLTAIVDAYGASNTFTYNSSNWVSTVTDWKGRSLTFTYSGTPSRLTSVADSTSRSVSYGYTANASGQLDLTSFTDPESKTTTYSYDTNHDIVATFDANNQLVVSNIYDVSGRIATQYTAGSTNRTWQVYWAGYQTSVVDPMGGEQDYFFDDKARQIGFKDALGNIAQNCYDGQDHVTNTVSPLNETNQFIYDGNNNMIETIDPLGSSNTFAYDSQNNLTTATDARRNSSHFGYNSQFSLTGFTNGNGNWVVSTFNTDGTLHTRQDSGGTSTYGYDSYGQLNSLQYPGSLGTEGFLNSAAGDMLSHTNARTLVTTFQYNQRRQLTNTIAPTNLAVSMGYDAVGNLQSSTDARTNSTTYSWSVTRHQTGTTFPSTPQGTPVVTNLYDVRDWMTQTQNPLQEASYYSNNPAQQLIAVADALLRTNTLSYDPDGHLIHSTDAASETTLQSYDAKGEVIALTDPATNVVGNAYDPAGNLIFLTNRNHHVWQFQYDAANRLTNTISPTGKTTAKVFNNRGLLQSVTVAATNTATYSYDAKRRMTNRNDTIGNIGYQFDGDNNVTAVTNVGQGSGLSWVYDAYDRPASFTDASGNQIQYLYDANGNLTNLIYPGGLPVKYYYDNLNRLTNVTDWAGRQTTNTYDLGSELTSIARPNGTIRTVAYDAAGETTNIVERYSSGAMAIDYFAESWNNAARMQWEFVAPLPHPYTPPSRTMTCDNDNRLATFNGTNVTIDNQGNMIYGPGTNNSFITYSYDARNRLTGARGLTYGYDPANNRTSLTNGSMVETFVVDLTTSQVLMRIKPGVTNYYIYGAGLLYEIDVAGTNTTTLYYHFDSRGSTDALTDTNGNITDRMEYAAYGMLTYRVGTNDTPFLYNGRYGVETDPNGLLFMRARYYNPLICRFLNADQSGFSGGLNMYQFASGNPISGIDPFGLGPDYGNPVSGRNGPAGPSNPYAAGLPYYPNGPFYTPSGLPPPTLVESLATGVFVGAGVAFIVAFVAPAAVTGLTALGVPSTAASATVTFGLGTTAVVGGVATGVNTYNNAVAGNWNAVAFNAGTLVGGAIVGVSGGGQALAEGISGQPTSAQSGLFGDSTLNYNPNYPNDSILGWLGSGPTPQSGGAAATFMASGTGLFLQPLPQGSQSSSTGK